MGSKGGHVEIVTELLKWCQTLEPQCKVSWWIVCHHDSISDMRANESPCYVCSVKFDVCGMTCYGRLCYSHRYFR
jgi:hypothetical protein